MAVAVWAESRDVPGNICSDARLAGGSAGPVEYPSGSAHGQAGWTLGLKYRDLEGLARSLTAIKSASGPIGRLAIHLHGQMNGVLFVEGQERPKNALNPDNLKEYTKALSAIGNSTTQDATILFMGCIAGLGPGGSRLVKDLSKVWPGRAVVAFTTIGYVNVADMLRASRCTEPGMRETGNSSPTDSAVQERIYGPKWHDLTKMPWQSEKSNSAKVAVNGVMTKGSQDEGGEPESMPYWLDPELSAAWNSYIECKAFNYQSSCVSEFGKFLQVKDGPDRRNYNWTGNSGLDGNQPPWKESEAKLIEHLRSRPRFKRRRSR